MVVRQKACHENFCSTLKMSYNKYFQVTFILLDKNFWPRMKILKFLSYPENKFPTQFFILGQNLFEKFCLASFFMH